MSRDRIKQSEAPGSDFRRQILWFLEACCTALALNTSLAVSDVEWAGIHHSLLNLVYTLLEQVQQGMEEQGFSVTVLIVLFFAAYRALWAEEARPAWFTRVLSIVLAVLYTGGLAFDAADSLTILWKYKVNLLRTEIALAGTYWMYLALINALYRFLQSRRDLPARDGRQLSVYRAHPWLSAWAVLLICWLPHLLLHYPGIMSYDNYNQLMYYYGYKTFTTAQPIFHTWLFGTFVEAGNKLGHPEWGLFAFTLMQSLIMAAVLASMLLLMRRWGAARWLRLLTLAVFAVCPYYAGYAAFPIKDYLYTAFLAGMVLLIMEYLREPEVFRTRRGRILLPACWVVCCAAMMLIRNNGPYIYYGTLVLLIPAIVRECRREQAFGKTCVGSAEDGLQNAAQTAPTEGSERPSETAPGGKSVECGKTARAGRIALILLCLLLPIAVNGAVNTAIRTAYDVQQNSPGEMLSVFFQQTARYVRDYGDEVTQEEQEAIAAVLDYDNLADLYMESLSDPVKTTYHGSGTGDLIAYFRVWLSQFLKHPLCYVEATWNQYYYLFAPWKDIVIFNQDSLTGQEMLGETVSGESAQWLAFEVPDALEGFGAILVSWYTLLTQMPVVGMFSNIAFYVILMCVLFVFFLADGRARDLKVMIPVILSFCIVILSPGILIHPRYAFPILYCMPAVAAFYQSGVRDE